MNVIKIPAKPQKGNNASKQEVKKLRVAAYCRVSTDNEEQATSLSGCMPMTVSARPRPKAESSSMP